MSTSIQPAFLALDENLEQSIKTYFESRNLPVRIFRSMQELIEATASPKPFNPGFIMVGHNDQNKNELGELLDKIKFSSGQINQVPVFVISEKDDVSARELSYKKACTGYIVLPSTDHTGNQVKLQNIYDFWSICERSNAMLKQSFKP